MKAKDILKELQANKYAPIYLLQGEEPYYIDQVSNYIEKHALNETEKTFNQTIFYGKDISVFDLLNSARRYPIMSERQVVIVKEAQSMDIFIREKKGESELLTKYLSDPQPATILVICIKYKKLDKRKQLYKAFEKYGVVLESNKLYDNQLPDWIEEYVKSKNYTITNKAIHILTEHIGNNLERLNNEISKTLLNYSENTTIDENIIERNIGISKEYNVFELQKALVYKNILKANKIINYFSKSPKDNPIIPIIAVLFSFFSKILIIHSSPDKSEGNITRQLKINRFFVKEYIRASNSYSLQKTVENIRHLKNADLQSKGIKGNSMPGEQILKELIFKLTH